jgi:hypothetical protein
MRIYLDTNVFTQLRKPERKTDLDFLLQLKKKHVFVFSEGHLEDLNQDQTERKLGDLNFMERLVDRNYFVNDQQNARCNILMASPTEAFNGRTFFNPAQLRGLVDQLEKPYATLVKGFMSIRLPLNLATNIAAMDEQSRSIWLKLIPDPKDIYTLGEWVNLFAEFIEALHTDRSVYKGLRGAVREAAMGVGYSLKAKDVKIIDQAGKEWSFVEMINESVRNSDKSKTPSEHDYFTTTFMMLNLMGLDNESSSKARFVNTHNDAAHAFFGGHCDYVVSDDVGFLVKASMIYGMRAIQTEPMGLDQFLQRMRYVDQITEQTCAGFFTAIGHGLRHSFAISSPSVMFPWRTYVDYRVKEHYLNYFNTLQTIHEGERTFLLLERQQDNLSVFDMFSEYQVVIEQLIDLFGMDDDGLGRLNAIDVSQLREGTWKGRCWTFDSATIYAEVNQGTRRFNLLIL